MEGLQVTFRNGLKIIKFNRPRRRNAVNKEVYVTLPNILHEDSTNNSIVATILTGEGDYFTSGNDMKEIMEMEPDKDIDVIKTERNQIFKRFVQSFIDYPKILIAIVNGPAIGIGATIIGLCDIVYATNNATFHTPFLDLGLCCEGCSSYLFPLYMGRSKASEMIMLGKKINAREAYESGLISAVIPQEKLDDLYNYLESYASLPVQSVIVNKKLIMDPIKERLHDCNNRECAALMERSSSDEFMNAVTKFITKKSKL